MKIDDLVSVITAALQGGLLLAAIWLAWETRALRKTSRDAIVYSQVSERNRIAPQVRILVREDDDDEELDKLEIRNVSSNLAVNCVGFIYDRDNHNFIITQSVRDFIEPTTRIFAALSSNRYDINGFVESVEKRLSGLLPGELRNLVTEVITAEKDLSVVGYIFNDVLRSPYIQFRLFVRDEDGIHYRISRYAGRPRQLKRRELSLSSEQ